jgi:hypothetical protein
MQYYSATVKNDAILQRDTNNTNNTNNTILQYFTMHHQYCIVFLAHPPNLAHFCDFVCRALKNDAILQRVTKKRCNITARH